MIIVYFTAEFYRDLETTKTWKFQSYLSTLGLRFGIETMFGLGLE